MKIKTLDDAIAREHLKYRKLEARLALKEQLKMEAYDDSPIDNQWVAQKEAEIPGLITGLDPNHNYTITPNEENKQIIMESLPSSDVLKGSLVVAALMIVFKVLSVIRNNSAFANGSGGGGNGRGSATGTKQQIERLTEAGRESKDKIGQVERVAQAFKPDHIDEDSNLARALNNLRQDITYTAVDEKSKDINVSQCVDAIKEFDLSSIRKLLENLPVVVYIKDQNIVNSSINKLNKSIDFIVDVVSGVGGGSLEKLFIRLRDQNENIIAAKSVDDIERALGMYKEINQKFAGVGLIQEAKVLMEGVRELTTPIGSVNGSTRFQTYSVDDIISSIKDHQDDLSKVSVIGMSLALSNFNEQFDTKFEPNIKLDDHEMKTIVNTITVNKKLQDVANIEKDPPELRERKETALRSVNLLSNSIVERILKPLAEFRARADRVNTFIDKLTKKFEDINTSADRVISASNDDPL